MVLVEGDRAESVSMWIDARVVMRHSPIHGVGSFAAAPIRAGDRLMRTRGGLLYTTEDARQGRLRLAAEMYNEEQVGPDLFRAVPKSPEYYLNHSCEPNVLAATAVRDIVEGEELLTDYAHCEAGDSVLVDRCRCGSAGCRGRITGLDWTVPDLQRRYEGYFTPYVQSLIDAHSRGEASPLG
jgi:SET domain-containing protein